MSEIERHDRNSGTDLLADSSDRKITRNQKRRHDEINHVQKVYIYLYYIKNCIAIYEMFFLLILLLIYCFRLMQKWILLQLH